MARGGGISGTALAAILAGSAFLYAGIKGKSITSSLQNLIKGQSPAGASSAFGIVAPSEAATGSAQPAGVSGNLAPGGGTNQANRALVQLMAAGYGWTGAEWAALDRGWGTLESGFNNQIYSGGQVGGPYKPNTAYGIAQALGHGPDGAPYPAGNGANPPGAGGTSSAADQIAWGLAYIKGKYGKPTNVPGWTGGAYSGY
jgi:hypothetical protein